MSGRGAGQARHHPRPGDPARIRALPLPLTRPEPARSPPRVRGRVARQRAGPPIAVVAMLHGDSLAKGHRPDDRGPNPDRRRNAPLPERPAPGRYRGPVGAGKTALMAALCSGCARAVGRGDHQRHLYARGCRSPAAHPGAAVDRIVGVETGGCPHTAIREDASINLAAVDDLVTRFPDLDLIFIESGGDNLSATFSPLADLTLYVIDVSPATRSRARAAPASPAPTCSSSTRSTSRRMSAPRST